MITPTTEMKATKGTRERMAKEAGDATKARDAMRTRDAAREEKAAKNPLVT